MFEKEVLFTPELVLPKHQHSTSFQKSYEVWKLNDFQKCYATIVVYKTEYDAKNRKRSVQIGFLRKFKKDADAKK